MKKRKLHYNKQSRKIGFVKARFNAKSYKTVRGYINRLFKEDKNYNELVRRLETESPELFDNPYTNLYGKRDDKKAVLEFVTQHAKEVYRDMLSKNKGATIEQAIHRELNTRAYVSNDELIQNNVATFARRRKNQEFRQTLQRLTGTKRIPWQDLTYERSILVDNGKGSLEEVKGYVFKNTNIVIISEGSGNQQSPYTFSIRFAEKAIY